MIKIPTPEEIEEWPEPIRSIAKGFLERPTPEAIQIKTPETEQELKKRLTSQALLSVSLETIGRMNGVEKEPLENDFDFRARIDQAIISRSSMNLSERQLGNGINND